MVDASLRSPVLPATQTPIRKRSLVGRTFGRKSTIAFLMALPLILLIAILVIYPAMYSIYLATLNKGMTRFVGFGNFQFLFKRETFWMVVEQSCIFAITAVIFKAIIGFIVAHLVHNIPDKGQRKWRGMLLVPWVIPPAMSTLAWLWLFDPSYSAFNWLLSMVNINPIPWTGDAYWARFSIILVNVWIGSPFFMIMYLAALKSVPEQLYEAAAIDGANWWVKFWSIGLPLLVPIIAATFVVRWLGAVKMFDIALSATSGGPGNATNVVNLYIYEQAFRSLHFAEAAAMTVIVLAGTVVLTLGMLWGSRKLEDLY